MKGKILTFCFIACLMVTAAYAAPYFMDADLKDFGISEFIKKDTTIGCGSYEEENTDRGVNALRESGILLFFGTGILGVATFIRRRQTNH